MRTRERKRSGTVRVRQGPRHEEWLEQQGWPPAPGAPGMRAAVRAQMSWPGALPTPAAAARGRNGHGGRGHGAHDGLNHHGSSLVPQGDWLRLPGRERLIRGVVPRLLVEPYPASDGDCHIPPVSARIVVASTMRARGCRVSVSGGAGELGPGLQAGGTGTSTSRLPAGSAAPSPWVRAASGAYRSSGSAQDVASTRTAWVGPQIVSST